MHMEFGTVLIVTTVLASLVLLGQKSDRMFPMIAVVAAALQALMVFGVLTLTLAKFRVDVILPGLLVLAGAVCWSRASTKTSITAGTLVTTIGAIELLLALRLFS
jgi:hypothetical protein